MSSASDDVHLLLGAYLLGGLSENDRRAFQTHLGSCSTCRLELRQLDGLLPFLDLADPSRMAAHPAAILGATPSSASNHTSNFGVTELPEPASRRVHPAMSWLIACVAAAVLVVAAGLAGDPGVCPPPISHAVQNGSPGSPTLQGQPDALV